jgi:hypothetical protein
MGNILGQAIRFGLVEDSIVAGEGIETVCAGR